MSEYRLPLVAKQITDEIWSHVQALQGLVREAKVELQTARSLENESHCKFLAQYHALERMGKFNACEGWRIAKALQDTLVTRRQAKWDSDSLERLVGWIDATDLVRFLDRQQPSLLKLQKRIGDQNIEHERYLQMGGDGEMEDAS